MSQARKKRIPLTAAEKRVTVAAEMSRLAIRLGFPSLLIAAMVAATGRAQGSSLHFVANAENFGVLYVERPTLPALYVFYEDEPVRIRFDIGNRSDLDKALVTSKIPLAAAFHMRVVQTPGGTVPAQLTVAPEASGMLAGTTRALPWGDELRVAPRSSIEWTATLVAPGPPGFYEFHFAPAFRGEDGPIHPQGTIVRYELRAVSSAADRAEVAMRDVFRALSTEDDRVIEAAVQRLLAIYPSSAHAYQIRGEISKRAGRRADAVEAFSRAAALIESGADTLFLAQAGASRAQETVNWIRLQLSLVK